MKRAIYFWLTTPLLLTSCAMLQSVTGFQKPLLRFKTLHLENVSLSQMTLDFEFEVDNPNSMGLNLASLDYQLDVDKKTFAKGKRDKRVAIAANGASPLRVPFTVEFVKLGEAVAALFSNANEIPYRLQAGFGVATPVGTIRLPVDVDGKVPLPKLPDVSVADVKLGKLGLMGAELDFTFNVGNRNSFPVSVKGGGLDIRVAGASIGQSDMKVPELGAGQTAAIRVPLKLSFLQLGTSVVSAIKSKQLPYDVRGNLDLGVFKQPFNLSGKATF